MTLVQYDASQHSKHLKTLFESRDEKILELPNLGWIVLEEETPIACLFMRRCEGNMFLGDMLVTNSACSSNQRHEALNLIGKKLVEATYELKIKYVALFSAFDSVKNRCQALGFTLLPHTLMIYKNEECS